MYTYIYIYIYIWIYAFYGLEYIFIKCTLQIAARNFRNSSHCTNLSSSLFIQSLKLAISLAVMKAHLATSRGIPGPPKRNKRVERIMWKIHEHIWNVFVL